MNPLTKIKLRLNKHFGMEFFARSAYGMDIVAIYDFTGKINLNGSHSKLIESVVNELEDGDCFIDIGANVGIFSLIASDKVGHQGKVISFEPNPEVFRLFQKNLIHNKLSNVISFNAGISDEDAVISFLYDPHHNGLGHIKASDDYKWDRKDQKEIQILTLGENSLQFLEKACADHQKVIIKIDTEGAEFKVLLGLKQVLQAVKPYKLIVELSDEHLGRFGHTMDDVYDYMIGLGYKGSVDRSKVELQHHFDEVFVYGH